MATFTVERTYWCPVVQHLTIDAASAEEAMRAALVHDCWDSAKTCYEDCRSEHISGCWEGAETAYMTDGLPIPDDLGENPLNAPTNHWPSVTA